MSLNALYTEYLLIRVEYNTQKAAVIFDMTASFLWTQRGMIPRPSDYESAALTN